ncbi:hypothetical protein A0221_02515 [Listeria monocytogenes]|nr:hypothetical protein [Listeria monocytogenes]EAF8769716.1 hypothetical protein [Listeria monocytogenes]
MAKHKYLLKKWWLWLATILILGLVSFMIWYTQSYTSEWGKGLSKEDITVLENANKSTNEFNQFAKAASAGVKVFEKDIDSDPKIVIKPFSEMGDNIIRQSDDFIKMYDDSSGAIQIILKDDYAKIKKFREDVSAQKEEIKSIYTNAYKYSRNLSAIENTIVSNVYQAMHDEQIKSLGLKKHEFNKNAELNAKAKKLIANN